MTGGGAQCRVGLFEAVEGGELVGRRVAFQGGVLFLGDIGEAVAEAVGGLGLGDGFAAIQLRAAGVGACIGAEQEAVPGAQRQTGLGVEFAAMAAVGESGVVGLLLEVAELQGAVVLRRTQFDTCFAWGVVEDELVVAALPALAGGQLLGFDAGEAGLMGVGAVLFSGEEGRGVGAGLLGATSDPVALGVGVAATVVGAADDDGAVDVAVLEGDEDFLAGTGNEMPAPVGTGDRGHDAQPDAEAGIGRGVVASRRVVVPGAGVLSALPRELDADAAVAVGVGGATVPYHDGGQGAAGGGSWVDVSSLTVGHQRFPGDHGADGGEGVAVVVDLGPALLCRVGGADFLEGVPQGDFFQGGTGFVGDGGDQEAALFGSVPVVFGMVGQGKGGAGGLPCARCLGRGIA